MNIVFTPTAWEQYTEWQREDKKMVKRINELVKDIDRSGLLKSLEENPKDWKKEWSAIGSRPYNADTNAVYKGINRLRLQYVSKVMGYDDVRWATFKQIQKNDWHLTKGSKGVQVEYWLPYDTAEKKALTWKEYAQMEDTSAIQLVAELSSCFI